MTIRDQKTCALLDRRRRISVGAANIHFGPDCWEWMGGRTGSGYGAARNPVSGKQDMAHRVWFETYSDEKIPIGMQVLHRCDNRLCVRRDHLFLGTQKDNMIDKANKGRAPMGVGHFLGRRNACHRGHKFTPENTRMDGKHGRSCRTCVRSRQIISDRKPERSARKRELYHLRKALLGGGK